ncbi:protein lifeguard 1 [Brachionichthys hirsutus]|uniref:protein lifeguard 1 n=1 Tax=Brachionichthys hirsutus TaxID=412623 RepID=UPI003604BBFA
MSDTADVLTETEAAPPGYDSTSPPPSYSYQEQRPPHKVDTSCSQPAAGYESFRDICPEAPSDTTPLITSSSFYDKSVRRGFVRKVFSILALQLLFTFSVVCAFTFSSVVKRAVQINLWAYLSSFIIFAIVVIALSCCRSFSRRHPWNLVGLVVVTLSLSYMVGTVASFHDTIAVVITMGTTLAITFTIIGFSAQARFDFTLLSGVLMILLVDLVLFGVFSAFYYSYVAEIAYGCLGALLYSLFLVIDCQLLMGLMSHRLDPEEYVNAALMIYMDVVLIFLCLLGRR